MTFVPVAVPGLVRAEQDLRERLLAPTLIVLGIVAGWPLLRTIWFGFTDANLSDMAAAEFIARA